MIGNRGLSQAAFRAFQGVLDAVTATRCWTPAIGFAATFGLAGCLHPDQLSGRGGSVLVQKAACSPTLQSSSYRRS